MATIEVELRAALAALARAREDLAHAVSLELRAVAVREIASAELSIGRVLHLIAGRAA
jgi:hypothetical protein